MNLMIMMNKSAIKGDHIVDAFGLRDADQYEVDKQRGFFWGLVRDVRAFLLACLRDADGRDLDLIGAKI